MIQTKAAPKAHKYRKLEMILYTSKTINNDMMKNYQRLDTEFQFEPVKLLKTLRNSSNHNIAQEAMYSRRFSSFRHVTTK